LSENVLDRKVIKSTDFEEITGKIIGRTDDRPVTLIGGITTAYPLGENELREFFILDKIESKLKSKNIESKFIILNDTYDGLTGSQAKVLSKNGLDYQDNIGEAINRIKCPCSDHQDLAQHFQEVLKKKLREFDIEFKIERSEDWQKDEVYERKAKEILEEHDSLKKYLESEYDLNYERGLFHPICVKCGNIKDTRFEGFDGESIQGFCEKCGESFENGIHSGKFTWKIECALRWYVNDVDFEPFMRNYLSKPSGSFLVTSDILDRFFEEEPPLALKFAYLPFNKNIPEPSRILPEKLFRSLMTENIYEDNISEERLVKLASEYSYPSGIRFLDASRILSFLDLNDLEGYLLESIGEELLGIEENGVRDHCKKLVKFSNKIDFTGKYEKSKELSNIENKKDVLEILAADNPIEFLHNNIESKRKDEVCRDVYRALLERDSGCSLSTLIEIYPEKDLEDVKRRLEEN
jgi:hypothetical protein